MIRANELVFTTVKYQYANREAFPPNFDSIRYIKGEILEKNWLKNCKLKGSIRFSNERRFCILEHDNKVYFVATGLSTPDSIPSGFQEIAINPGLFTLLIFELELPILSGISNNLLDNILSQSSASSSYDGHDYAELARIFPHIFVAELTNQYLGDSANIEQVSCVYLSCNKIFLALPFSDNTLDSFRDLILISSGVLNYESLLHAITSSQFKFAFLDIYRCIEMLFQIVYIDTVYSKLGITTITKSELLNTIDNELSWKPAENSTLRKIFSETPSYALNQMTSVISSIHAKIQGGHSAWLYKLRCNVVHLKSKQNKSDLNESQWDGIIQGMCKLLIFWYTKYQTLL